MTQLTEQSRSLKITQADIKDIKENVSISSSFAFSKVGAAEMLIEINALNDKKSGTFINIPVKRLKEVGDIVAGVLSEIWNEEIR